MRKNAIKIEHPEYTPERILELATSDLVKTGGGASAWLNMDNKFIETKDGRLVKAKEGEEGENIFNLLSDKVKSHPEIKADPGAGRFLAHLKEFSDALAQVWSNDTQHHMWETAFIEGQFKLVTIDKGLKDPDRVYTDNSGLNALMKMIISWQDVTETGKKVSEADYIRLTERNLHTQITAMELMSLIPGLIGYTGTAEVARSIFDLKSVPIEEIGMTMVKEMFNERLLKLFTGTYKDQAASAAGDWLNKVSSDPHMARVLLLNMVNEKSRTETVKELKGRFGNSVEIIEAGPKGFSDVMEKEISDAKYKGKRVIVVSAGESGVSPDKYNVELWHYDFDIRGMYAHLQAMARSDTLKPGMRSIKQERMHKG